MRKYDDAAVKELIKKVQCGNDEESNTAQKELYEDNIGLVRSVMKRYVNRGTDSEDLFQIGSIGLIKAIRNFDLSFDVCFSTYAVPMIAGEIRRYLRDEGPIKVSRSVKELGFKIKAYVEEVQRKSFREPLVSEIAQALEVEKEDIVMAIEAARIPESIYAPVDENSPNTEYLIDKILQSDDSDTVGYERLLDRIALEKAMEDLNEEEKKIIQLRYFGEMTQTQIAEKLGVSQVQVSRMEKKILIKMRIKLTEK
ncbi:MAG: SigB/SigF/SigG family RNA polymerase sigma factor [Ruminococcaceae bacterium]|nr:SigB/SigF/SigG family RNA polymerase sigma factor [Oscillospiraceae bacterium]